MNKSVLLLGNKSNIGVFECNKGIFNLTRSKNLFYYETENNEKLKIRIKRHTVFMMFEGEEFYIKLIKIPKVATHLIDSLVVNELTYIFKDINQINFTYDIFSKDRKEINILVFCINSEKNNLVSNLSEQCNIKGIYLIQLYIFEYIKKRIACDKAIVVFQYSSYTYILASLKGKIIGNAVLKDFHEDSNELHKKLSFVIGRADEIELELDPTEESYKVFLVNIENEKISDYLSKEYSFINLGSLNFEKIIDELR